MRSSVVAIDGPAASGKSTVARRVAAELGYFYVDSGAVYRSVAWECLRQGVDVNDAAAVCAALPGVRMAFEASGGAVHGSVNGRDPGIAIRQDPVNRAVTPIAANPDVRRLVTGWLRDLALFGDLVMEGRDIGTVVFPDAPWKFYLDASPEVRAQRRHAEIAARREDSDVRRVGEALQHRDRVDSSRASAPLRIAEGAVTIDSSAMGVDEVVRMILERVTAGAGSRPAGSTPTA